MNGSLALWGEVIKVKTEAEIDAVTAVSGSGPAYFFLLAEALEKAARAQGFDDESAAQLARATLIGAGAMANKDAQKLSDMRKAVTSPGGTTEAALNILGKDSALNDLVDNAVRAAVKRAKELTS